MFRLYDLAYNSYHTVKKEFTSDINNTSQQSTEILLNKTLYLAGALEMASLSNFMQNFSVSDQGSLNTSITTSTNNKTYNLQYIDEAILLLLNTCKNNYFATRCALLSTEALKANNLFVKAAYQFISLSSDESDMRSALFLEQAAQCYLAMNMIRKYAFFMSIAGYRFNKAGQVNIQKILNRRFASKCLSFKKRRHAIRVYKHALDIYENRNWFKAQDHLNFVASRLNYNLKSPTYALNHIQRITVKKRLVQKSTSYYANQANTTASHHSKVVKFTNEVNVLRDFILYCSANKSDELPSLSVPIINCDTLKVNLLPIEARTLKRGEFICLNDFHTEYRHEPVSLAELEIMKSLANCPETSASRRPRDMWTRFEQALYTSAYRSSVPLMFKPQVSLLDNTSDNKQMPKLVVDETCVVMFEMRNILRMSLPLFQVTLLWRFKDDETSGEVDNEVESHGELVECSLIREVILAAGHEYKVRFSVRPRRSNGVLSIVGLKYRIGLPAEEGSEGSTSLLGKQMFEIKGSRLNNTQANMRNVVYDVDNRLNFKVVEHTASLQV